PLNSQPMGFYSPSQIVQDARRGRAAREGVEFLPVDVVHSDWDNTLVDGPANGENPHPSPCGSGHGRDWAEVSRQLPDRKHRGHGRSHSHSAQPAIRLGLREIRRLSEEAAAAIVAARARHPFRSVADLCLRANLDEKARSALAEAGALRTLAGNRNDARWLVAGIERQRPLLPGSPGEDAIALPAPGMGEEILSDYRATGLSLAAHPLALLRDRLRARRLLGSADLRGQRHGRSV